MKEVTGLAAEDILYGRLDPAATPTDTEARTKSRYKKLGNRQRAVLKLLDPDDFTAQHSSLQLAVDEIHQKQPEVFASASAVETVLYSLRDRELVETNGIDWKITELGSQVISELTS